MFNDPLETLKNINDVTPYTKDQAITEILYWLYVNDGNHPNKLIWREELVKKLKAVINNIQNDTPTRTTPPSGS